MAGLAHAGVGLAAKRFAPTIPLAILLVSAYALDILWGAFYFAGLEHLPTPGVVTTSPWSHGLFMAVIWSALAGFITKVVTRNLRTSFIVGLIVFSHWVVDFISHPMRAIFPSDVGLPLLFDDSPTVGLGLWSYQAVVYIGEYGTLILGVVIYIIALRNIRKQKLASVGN